MIAPEVKENFPVCAHVQEGSLGLKREGSHHIMCEHARTGLCSGIHS